MDANGMCCAYDLSVEVALVIGAESLRCWRNAALAVLLLPELFAFGTYVEGWIAVPREKMIEIVEHGWCVAPDHGIVDPSVVLTEKRDQPVFYFPGRELASDELRRLLAGSTLPLVCHSQYGDNGMGHSGYKQAYDKAWRQAKELATQKRLPACAINVSTRNPRRGITVIVEPPQG